MAEIRSSGHFTTEQVTTAKRPYFHDAFVVIKEEDVLISAPSTGHVNVNIQHVGCPSYRYHGKSIPAIKCFGTIWLPWNLLCNASGMVRQLMNYRIMNSPQPIPVLRFPLKEDLRVLRAALPKACQLGPNAVMAVFIAVDGLPHIFARRTPTVPPHIRKLGDKYIRL